MNIAPATTSVILIVKIVDDAGLPVTGLVAATFPTTYYTKVGVAATAITLSDLAFIASNYSSGGVKEIGGGRYRLDVPDAAFSASNRMVEVFGEATNKHIVAPQITCQYMQSDIRQWVGKIPIGLYGNADGGKLQVHDRRIILEYAGTAPFTFGASTIEWGPGGIADDFLVGQMVLVIDSTTTVQVREIISSDNATGVMTVDRPWDTAPDTFGEIFFYVKSIVGLQPGAISDDSFTVPTLTGPATGVVGRMTQLWRRFFKRVTKSATQIKTYADDGTTVTTTQGYTSVGDNDDVGAAT